MFKSMHLNLLLGSMAAACFSFPASAVTALGSPPLPTTSTDASSTTQNSPIYNYNTSGHTTSSSATPTPTSGNSYILYVSGVHYKKGIAHDANVYIGDVGPACSMGFKACVQTSLIAVDDLGKCQMRALYIYPNIARNIDPSLPPYRVTVKAFAWTESGCENRGVAYNFVVTCVPPAQVETAVQSDLSPAYKNNPQINLCTTF
jgi:hypothetical protein